jgi:hypothetical protein
MVWYRGVCSASGSQTDGNNSPPHDMPTDKHETPDYLQELRNKIQEECDVKARETVQKETDAVNDRANRCAQQVEMLEEKRKEERTGWEVITEKMRSTIGQQEEELKRLKASEEKTSSPQTSSESERRDRGCPCAARDRTLHRLRLLDDRHNAKRDCEETWKDWEESPLDLETRLMQKIHEKDYHILQLEDQLTSRSQARAQVSACHHRRTSSVPSDETLVDRNYVSPNLSGSLHSRPRHRHSHRSRRREHHDEEGWFTKGLNP